MANCKLVHLKGKMPYGMEEKSEIIKDWLASMNTPVFGLHIRWGKEVKSSKSGKMLYPFDITGIEAVSFKAFDAFEEAIKQIGGEIDSWSVADMEA